ncbi:hypothetical protein SO694_00001456 [Aureococcus anophagefferens]|uniref:Uncharacterized protein n=1 Tax=Aureococcus anophagefferens TaxID=44056 RepID=A0ABR1GBQ0_AURAN
MFAAEDCAIDAVDALIEATFVSLEGPAEVRLFRFSARACLDDAWAVANLGNLGCDDPYGGGGRRYVFGGGGAICALVGASAGSGWFAEAEPAPSDIDSHATSHVSVRAPPPLPDDDASARTSAVSRESSFRGSFRGSFRASSRGSLYRGGSSRGSMRSSMYQGKRLTMKRTSTILEPFIVQCGGEDELDAEHAKPSLEFATLLGEIARAEEMHVAAQINFIVRAAEKADDEAKFKKQCKELRGKRHVFDANGDAVLLASAPADARAAARRAPRAPGFVEDAAEDDNPVPRMTLAPGVTAVHGRTARAGPPVPPEPGRMSVGEYRGSDARARSAALGDHRDRHGNNVIVAYAGPKRSRPPSRAVVEDGARPRQRPSAPARPRPRPRRPPRAPLDLRFAASFVDDASELTIASTLNLVPGFVDTFARAPRTRADGGGGGGGGAGGDERDENLSLISRSDWGVASAPTAPTLGRLPKRRPRTKGRVVSSSLRRARRLRRGRPRASASSRSSRAPLPALAAPPAAFETRVVVH